jgi:hypothetical protein
MIDLIAKHKQAAMDLEEAAKHHREAARHHEVGNHEKAQLNTMVAHGYTSLAKEPQNEILKYHSQEF